MAGEPGFVAVDGDHFVTVPSGNQNHPELIGVQGKLLSVGKNAQAIAEFNGSELTISAFDLIPFGQFGNETSAVASGPTIGIYFGTETGNTQDAAEAIRDKLTDCNVTACADIADCAVSDLLKHDVLLLGISTWNIGDIQFDWEDRLGDIAAQDYKGIKVGMFGLGDAAGYPDTFVDGLGILWDEIKGKDAELIGVWPTEGYEFDGSRGLFDDNNFLGLVLDEDNESELSEERIDTWVAQIRTELNLAPAI